MSQKKKKDEVFLLKKNQKKNSSIKSKSLLIENTNDLQNNKDHANKLNTNRN